MHIRRTLGSMVPEVVILLSYIGTCTYVQRPAAVFPYPHVPAALKQAPCCHWRRSYHQSQSPIESMHTRHPLETTLPSSSAAVCFLDYCLSSTRRVRVYHTATTMVSFFQVPDARRIRSFFTKLPLATRLLLLLFTAFYLAKAFRPELEQWGALIPQEINLGTRESCNASRYVGATNPRSAQSTD